MKSLVLIAGVARSGSTATDFILGNRGDSFSLGEVYAWYRPYRSHHREPVCSCGQGLATCEIWSRIGRPSQRHLHRSVAEALDVDVIVDSSKNLGWIRDAYRWGTQDGLNVQIVMPWRGAKAIAHSYWKRDVSSWATNLEGYVRRLDQLGLPWQPLIFDDLIDDPQACLEPLYASIGKKYESNQEHFWLGEFHSLFGSGGTRAQLGDSAAALNENTFPPEFETYWDEVAVDVRYRLDELDEQLRRGNDVFDPPRLPPRWYYKQRAINVKDRVMLQLRPDTDIR